MPDPLVTEHETHFTVARVIDRGDEDRLLFRFEPEGDVTQGPVFTCTFVTPAPLDAQGQPTGGEARGTIESTPSPLEDSPNTYLEEYVLNKEHAAFEMRITWTVEKDGGAQALTHEQSVQLRHEGPVTSEEAEPALIRLPDRAVRFRAAPFIPEDERAFPRAWPLESVPAKGEDPVTLLPGRDLLLTWEVLWGPEVERVVLHGGGFSQEVTEEGLAFGDHYAGGLRLQPRHHPPDQGEYRLEVFGPGRSALERVRVQGIIDLRLALDSADAHTQLVALEDVQDAEGSATEVVLELAGRAGSFRDLRLGLHQNKPAFAKLCQGIFPFKSPQQPVPVQLTWRAVAPPDGHRLYLDVNEMNAAEARAFGISEDRPEVAPIDPPLSPNPLPAVAQQTLRYDVTAHTVASEHGVLDGAVFFREFHAAGSFLFDADLQLFAGEEAIKSSTEVETINGQVFRRPGQPTQAAALQLRYDRPQPKIVRFDATDGVGQTTASVNTWSELQAAYEVEGDTFGLAFRVRVTPAGASTPAIDALVKPAKDPQNPKSGVWRPGADDPTLSGDLTLSFAMVPEDPTKAITAEATVAVVGANPLCTTCPIPEARALHDAFREALGRVRLQESISNQRLKAARFVREAARSLVTNTADGVDPEEVWEALLRQGRDGPVLAPSNTPDFEPQVFDTFLNLDIAQMEAAVEQKRTEADQACQAYLSFIKTPAFQAHLRDCHTQRFLPAADALKYFGVQSAQVREADFWMTVLIEKLAEVPSGRAFLDDYLDLLVAELHPSPGARLAAQQRLAARGAEPHMFTDTWKFVKDTAAAGIEHRAVLGKAFKHLSESLSHRMASVRGETLPLPAPHRLTDVHQRLTSMGVAVTPSDPEALVRVMDDLTERYEQELFPLLLQKLESSALDAEQFADAVKQADARLSQHSAEFRLAWFQAGLTVLASLSAAVNLSSKWGKGSGLDQVKRWAEALQNLFSVGEAISGVVESGLKASGKTTTLTLTDEGFKLIETPTGWGVAKARLGIFANLCSVVVDGIAAHDALQKGQKLKGALHTFALGLSVMSITATAVGFSAWSGIGALLGLGLAIAIEVATDPAPIEWLRLTPWGAVGADRDPPTQAAPAAYALGEVIDKFFEVVHGEVEVRLVAKTADPFHHYLRIGCTALDGPDALQPSQLQVAIFPEGGPGLAKFISTADDSVDGKGKVVFDPLSPHGKRKPALEIYQPFHIWPEQVVPGSSVVRGIVRDGETRHRIRVQINTDADPAFELKGALDGVIFEKPNG